MLRSRFRALWTGERGIAAIEFAMIAPILITLMFGSYDLINGAIISGQIYQAGHSISVSASSLAVQSDQSTTLTVTNTQQVLSAIFAEVPMIRSNAAGGTKSVTLTSIAYVLQNASCTSNCTYVPSVAWSVPYADPTSRYPGGVNTFQAAKRPCGLVNQVSATQFVEGDLTSLPTLGVTNPDSMLVVDVHYQYVPVFLGFFLKAPIDFWSTTIWPVRSSLPSATISNQYTTYDLTNQNAGVGKCAGFD